tara:strand:+ start:4609 stop:5100 length:492 start_codon:yes stop_codon:yes gene_type:complete
MDYTKDISLINDFIDVEPFTEKLFNSNTKRNDIKFIEENSSKKTFLKLLLIFNEARNLFYNNSKLSEFMDNDYHKIKTSFNLIGYNLHYKKIHFHNIKKFNSELTGKKIVCLDSDISINIQYPDKVDIYDLIDYNFMRSKNIKHFRYSEPDSVINYIIWFSKS